MIMIPDSAKAHWLKYVLGNETPDDTVTYHWFTNNFTPDDDTVIGDFTEASGGNILSLDVPNSEWMYSLVSHVEIAVGGAHVLDVTAAVTLYGYFVTPQDDDTILLWCERFESGPFVYASDGTLTFTPRITQFTCNDNVQYVYSSAGFYEFPVPPGKTKLTARAWGGGGGGGLSGSELIGGGGGGGGAYAEIIDAAVTPGQSVNLFVGAGGDEGDGSNSSMTVDSVLLLEAVKGAGGGGSIAGAGGLAADCTGDTAYDGGEGGEGDGAGSGGGGASGGTLGSGGDGLDGAFGGAGGSPAGTGGAGGQGGGLTSDGFAGVRPGGGGGGGGGGERAFASGAPGQIILVWS